MRVATELRGAGNSVLERLAAPDRELDADPGHDRNREHEPAVAFTHAGRARHRDCTDPYQRDQYDRCVHEQRMRGEAEQLRDVDARQYAAPEPRSPSSE
jgi:hypothetical protein